MIFCVYFVWLTSGTLVVQELTLCVHVCSITSDSNIKVFVCVYLSLVGIFMATAGPTH